MLIWCDTEPVKIDLEDLALNSHIGNWDMSRSWEGGMHMSAVLNVWIVGIVNI